MIEPIIRIGATARSAMSSLAHRVGRCQCLILAAGYALLLAACSSGNPAGNDDEGLPTPGSRGSGTTDANGVAVVRAGNGSVEVRVRDQNGGPLEGIKVALAAGEDVLVVVAADPLRTYRPSLRVENVASFAGQLRGDGNHSGAASWIDPLTITLVIGAALSYHELTSDPIHQKIVVDDGIAKSCTASDVNDVVALLSPAASVASGHVLVSMLGKSKAFAVVADVGFTAFTELLGVLGFMDQDRVLPGSCIVLVGDGSFSMQLVVLSGVLGGGILAQDREVPSTLYFVEPTQSGDDIPVAPIRTATGATPLITDLATWDEPTGVFAGMTLTHPTLYAISFDRLYRMNRATGIAEDLSGLGNLALNGLAFDAAGKLYASGRGGALLELSRQTGAIVRSVPLEPSVMLSGDILFLSSGRLLATIVGTADSDLLAEINPTTGITTVIGPIGHAGVFGLAHFDGSIWGLTEGGALIRINVATGSGTLIRSLTFGANGAGLTN